jgi:5-methylcytosine-specific restriction protein A
VLRELLHDISVGLSKGRPSYYAKHPLAEKIRDESPKVIEALISESYQDYRIEGSAGRGQWADTPWIAIYNLSVTDKASSGYYVVYLFPSGSNSIILNLGQSYHEAEREYGLNSNNALAKQSELMRLKLPEFSKDFESSVPLLKVGNKLDYRHAVAYHLKYDANELPTEDILISDLDRILEAYETLFYRGGRDGEYSPSDENDGIKGIISIEESHKKKVHYVMERPSLSQIKKIKKKLGYICEACDFDFEEMYGEVGKEYIEAHHLKPISELKIGESRSITQHDFSVLCSNCHRMIHKLKDSSDLKALKKLIGKTK